MQTLTAINNIGDSLRMQGKANDAVEFTQEAAERARRTLHPGHPAVGVILTTHGNTLKDLKRFAEAEVALLEAHEYLSPSVGPEHDWMIELVSALVNLYDTWHEAEPDQGNDAKGDEWKAARPGSGEKEINGGSVDQ